MLECYLLIFAKENDKSALHMLMQQHATQLQNSSNQRKNMHYSDFTMVKGNRTSHVCWKTPNRFSWITILLKQLSALKYTAKAEHLAVIDMS